MSKEQDRKQILIKMSKSPELQGQGAGVEKTKEAWQEPLGAHGTADSMGAE